MHEAKKIHFSGKHARDLSTSPRNLSNYNREPSNGQLLDLLRTHKHITALGETYKNNNISDKNNNENGSNVQTT